MQNRYVGDVGDFGKYALLRRLGRFPIRLGIVWCLFPDEKHNADGRHVGYLKLSEFQALDDMLIRTLGRIIETGQRRISSVVKSNILPEGTISCDEPIARPGRTTSRDRLSYRAAWLDRCLELTKNCDLVFFDPDNGIETASVPKIHQKAGKYIYSDELGEFWKRGNALLIYHHLNRTSSSAQQVKILRINLQTLFSEAAVLPLVFRRGSSRAFCLVHRGDAVGQELERRAADLWNTGWSRHFRPFGWPSYDYADTLAG